MSAAPDALTDAERQVWDALVAAIDQWMRKPTENAAVRVSRLGRAAYRTPIPPPRVSIRRVWMAQYVRLAKSWAALSPAAREQGRTVLNDLNVDARLVLLAAVSAAPWWAV